MTNNENKTATLEDAISIAALAHKGLKDKASAACAGQVFLDKKLSFASSIFNL